MTWDVPVKDNCPECGWTMFKKSGRGFKRPFCINPDCANFTPEDKRGGYKKKAAAEPKEGGEAAEAAEKAEKKTVKKTAAKKPAAKKAAGTKTTAKNTTAAKKTTAKKAKPAAPAEED